MDPTVLLSILREKLHDNRFLRLMANLCQAGYLEDWTYPTTLSGVPQGGVGSPILMHVYLDRLDQFVETVLLPRDNRGDCRKRYPPYMTFLNAARRKSEAGQREQAKRLRQQAPHRPSRDPADLAFRRLRYVRDADETRLGCSGSRAEAEEITGHRKPFLQDTLKRELSQDKTLITHARTHAARFLGYDVVTLDAEETHDHRGQRCISGTLGLKVPTEVIRATCVQYMQHGKPVHRAARLYDTDSSIVSQSQAEYRGLVQYYLLAFTVHRVWRRHRVMKLALVRTLANKHKSSLSKGYRKSQTTRATPQGTHKGLEVTVSRGVDKKPRVARFGGIALRWQKKAILNDRPKEVYSGRREVEQRLLAQHCELCGAEAHCEGHHIRKLADLHKQGRKDTPVWVKRMALRQRKTLGVCRACHEAIHYEKPKRHKSVA